jgi:hypothetical protein
MNIQIRYCEFCQNQEALFFNGFCFKCQPPSPNGLYEDFNTQARAWIQKKQELEAELTTERETTQQALQTSQTWHERQKAEIIAEWKEKLTNLIQQRKATIHQEITLLKEILNHE